MDNKTCVIDPSWDCIGAAKAALLEIGAKKEKTKGGPRGSYEFSSSRHEPRRNVWRHTGIKPLDNIPH